MTVGELIERLEDFNPKMDVIVKNNIAGNYNYIDEYDIEEVSEEIIING